MMTEPKVEDRHEQHSVGIRTQVSVREFPTVIPRLLGEVFAWLKKEGVAPAGAPFIRYHVINMPGNMDIELGVPVASAVAALPRAFSRSVATRRSSTPA